MSTRNPTNKDIVEQVKSWNFDFICVNPNVGYNSGGHRMIKIKHKTSGEIITSSYQYAKQNKILFPKTKIQKIIKELNEFNYGWICLDTYMNNGKRLVKLKHLKSKEILICAHQYAIKNKIIFPEYENLKVKNELDRLKKGWICLDTYIDKRVRKVRLQHIASKEIILCTYQNAKKHNVHFTNFFKEQENLKAKSELNKLKFGWVCLNSYIKNYNRKVKLKHLKTKEVIIANFHDAKKNKISFPEYENLKAKNKLNKLNYKWVCLHTYIYNKKRMAKLKHIDSKEIVTALYENAKTNNVRFPKYYEKQLNLDSKNKLNKLKYEWHCINTYLKNKRRFAKLQHYVSKEIITCQYQEAKQNKVRFPKYEDMKRFDNVNKLGTKSNPQYMCISSNLGYRGNNVLVSIQRKDGIGKVKKVLYNSLRQGSNPYNEKMNRVEVEKIQPMYERLFKKFKIKYIKEFSLGKKRIDFMFIINNKKYGLEVKQSKKLQSYTHKQIRIYKKLANLRQYNLEQVILSDPQGKHRNSISIKKLKDILKNNVSKQDITK